MSSFLSWASFFRRDGAVGVIAKGGHHGVGEHDEGDMAMLRRISSPRVYRLGLEEPNSSASRSADVLPLLYPVRRRVLAPMLPFEAVCTDFVNYISGLVVVL